MRQHWCLKKVRERAQEQDEDQQKIAIKSSSEQNLDSFPKQPRYAKKL